MSPTSKFTVLHLWTLTRNHPPRKALCPIWLNDETRIDSIEKERGVDKTSEISRIGRERGPFPVVSTKGGIPEKGRRGKREGPRPHATLTERKRSCRDVDVVRTTPTDWSSQRRVFQYARDRGPTLIARRSLRRVSSASFVAKSPELRLRVTPAATTARLLHCRFTQ